MWLTINQTINEERGGPKLVREERTRHCCRRRHEARDSSSSFLQLLQILRFIAHHSQLVGRPNWAGTVEIAHTLTVSGGPAQKCTQMVLLVYYIVRLSYSRVTRNSFVNGDWICSLNVTTWWKSKILCCWNNTTACCYSFFALKTMRNGGTNGI